jgi:hypothetical protein
MPYIGKSPQHGNYSKIDDISSGFDGSDATHAIASNSIAITPVRPEALIISMNGVIQEPVTDYTVSGTDITFTTAPASGDSFFGVVMGEQLAIGTPSDSTVTSAKLSGNLVTPGTLDVNGQELILDADADTSITADTDDQIDIRIAGADDFQFTANTFTAQSGSTIAAQALTATSIGTGDGSAGSPSYTFTSDTDTGMFWVSAGILGWSSQGTEEMRLNSQHLFLSETANTGAAGGAITINQQHNDDEILALKSSDVSHGATDFGETDTYGLFQKVSSTDGGLMVRGFSDGAVGMELRAMNTTNDTSDSSGSVGTMTLRSSLKTSGNTNDTNVGSTGNLIVFRDLTSTRVVIKGDGTVHAQDTSWATSLDTEDDMLALRMLDKAQSTKGVINSAWDSMIGTDWKYLQKIGVAGSDHPEKGHPDMFSMQGIQKLTMGATWYLGQNFMAFLETIEKRMPGIRKEFEDHMLEQSGRPAMLTQTTT